MMKYSEEIISESDYQLLQLCLQNSHSASKSLFDKYSKLLMSVSYRYAKDMSLAEDILQDSFIKIFNNLNDYTFSGSFEGWMKKIVVRTALNQVRKEANRNENFVSEDYELNSISTSNSGQENLLADDLLMILNQIPTGYRTVFQMYAIEGFSHKEIATELGITEGTSKSQLSKARSLLQSIINPVNHE